MAKRVSLIEFKRSEEARARIAASRKGKPSNNPTGSHGKGERLDKRKVHAAAKRVLKRMCSRCPYKMASMGNSPAS